MTSKSGGLSQSSSNIFSVETEVKAFLEELPRYKESLQDVSRLVSIIDRTVDTARSALGERKVRSLSPREELAAAAIEESLEAIETVRSDLSFRVPTPPISLREIPEMPALPSALPSNSDLDNQITKPSTIICEPVAKAHNTCNKVNRESGKDDEDIDNRGVANSNDKSISSLPMSLLMPKSNGIHPPPSDSHAVTPVTGNLTLISQRVSLHDVKWNKKFEELQAYKKRYGDCDVSSSRKKSNHCKVLGKWVSAQREAYNAKMNGRYSSLTNERIEALESIGFRWQGALTTNNSREVEAIDPTTNVRIHLFNSCSDAARMTGINRTKMSRTCRKGGDTLTSDSHGSLHFQYKEIANVTCSASKSGVKRKHA